MAIIYSYPKNTDILSTDIIVGTSTRVVNGRRKNITKNFEIGAIATFFNETSAIAITGQNNFFFQNNIAPGRKAGSISFVLGGGANTPFNNITALRISKFATSGTNVSDYISTLLEQALIIAQTDNLNSFGIYKCNSITPVDGNPNFLDLELEVLNANGNILEDKFYGFAVYPGFVNPNIDPANPITGTGTISYVPRFTGTTTIGNGSIFDNGTNIGIGTTVLTEKVNIVGKIDIIDGSNNVFIGRSSGTLNTTGGSNVSLGFQSFYSNLTGSSNTSFGAQSLFYNSSGSFNSSFGRAALGNNTTGLANIAIGYYSLFSNQIGNFNTAIGYRVLRNNLADKNTAVGAEAMFSNTTGTFNTVLGQEALRTNLAGIQNTSVGCFALLNAEANYVTALGRDAGRFSSSGNLTLSSNSIFLGYNSKSLNTSSINEIVIGANAVGLGDNKVVIGDNLIVLTALKGSIGIGTTSVNDYSILDVQSTVKGSRPFPRMTEAQRLAMPLVVLPVGLHVYQIDGLQEGVWVYKTLGWQFAY
jgi:hypothetical protein